MNLLHGNLMECASLYKKGQELANRLCLTGSQVFFQIVIIFQIGEQVVEKLAWGCQIADQFQAFKSQQQRFDWHLRRGLVQYLTLLHSQTDAFNFRLFEHEEGCFAREIEAGVCGVGEMSEFGPKTSQSSNAFAGFVVQCLAFQFGISNQVEIVEGKSLEVNLKIVGLFSESCKRV